KEAAVPFHYVDPQLKLPLHLLGRPPAAVELLEVLLQGGRGGFGGLGCPASACHREEAQHPSDDRFDSHARSSDERAGRHSSAAGPAEGVKHLETPSCRPGLLQRFG